MTELRKRGSSGSGSSGGSGNKDDDMKKSVEDSKFDRQFIIKSNNNDKKSNKQQDDEADDEELLKTTTSPTFFVTRWMIFRLLALCYFVAFLAAYNQNLGLVGSNGLQPAQPYWNALVENHYESSAETAATASWHGFWNVSPSIFWFVPLTDNTLDGIAIAGIVVSGLILTGVYVSWASWLLLWVFQFTLVSTTQHTAFYQYGWESQLLETTFLAIFLCELPHLESCWKLNFALQPTFQQSPSPIILWLFRWLCFRISMGAGLIKRRGSSCWTDRTCLWYHFETQPIPSPTSWFFHFLPRGILSKAVDLDMLVQYYTSPFILVVGNGLIVRTILRCAGIVQIGFMINIMISGNLAFLNHLTIVPALAALDDTMYPAWVVSWIVPSAYKPENAPYGERLLQDTTRGRFSQFPPRWFIDFTLLLLIGYLSKPVVSNLLQLEEFGGRQQMNASFDRFRLVNTYGAFGSVGQKRYEAIISIGTITEEEQQGQGQVQWTELEFPCKPGRLTKRPCFCSPYHYRIDWNIWFLGFEPHQSMLQRRELWLYNLLEKMLEYHDDESYGDDDKPWLDLLDSTSAEFLRTVRNSKEERSAKPKLYAKVDMYHYEMASPLWDILKQYWERATTSGGTKGKQQQEEPIQWWKRSYKEPLIQPIGWNPTERLYYAKEL